MSHKLLPFEIPAQPDDETCGISCLLGVYQYFGYDFSIDELLDDVDMLDSGGTLGVNLGIHALKSGFEVTLTSYNLQVFDPTWDGGTPATLIAKLDQQRAAKCHDTKLCEASGAFIEFLKLGGKIHFGDISARVFKDLIDRDLPVIVGLSSTFLYRSKREIPETTALDDVKGYPAGHFVVINGYCEKTGKISVCDPYSQNPLSRGNKAYLVDADHFLTAIFLGIITYDANFLTLEPKKKS